jgi:hypothetical protein
MGYRRVGNAPVGNEEKGMRKKAAAKRPRPRRDMVLSFPISVTASG